MIAASQGLLMLIGAEPGGDAVLDAPVDGIELHQPGVRTAAYAGKLVFVIAPQRGHDRVASMVEECTDAAAVIVPADADIDPAATPGIILLRRSPWVSTDALMRALVALTRRPGVGDAAATLERDAALAVHRQESALLALLRGAADAATPAALLGLRPDASHVVIAADVPDAQREAYRLALAAEYPEASSVVSEQLLFSVLSVADIEQSAQVTERLRTRMGRAIRSSADLLVGVGSTVPGVFALHESAAVARETLRALSFKLGTPWPSGHGGVRIAGAADVPDALALIRVGDALRPQGASLAAPLMRVAAYDREHGSELLASVLAALEHRENATDAARKLGIHANSLRARLDRVKEISGVDLADPVSSMRAIVAFLAFPEAHNTARRVP